MDANLYDDDGQYIGSVEIPAAADLPALIVVAAGAGDLESDRYFLLMDLTIKPPARPSGTPTYTEANSFTAHVVNLPVGGLRRKQRGRRARP